MPSFAAIRVTRSILACWAISMSDSGMWVVLLRVGDCGAIGDASPQALFYETSESVDHSPGASSEGNGTVADTSGIRVRSCFPSTRGSTRTDFMAARGAATTSQL